MTEPERQAPPTHRALRTRDRRLRRWIMVMAAAVATLSGAEGGIAYAYFVATGSGTGQVNVGRLLPVIVEHASATVSGVLLPGGTGTLALSITNPNPFALTLVGVTQDGPVTVTGGGPGCTSGTVGTPGTSGVTVSAGVASGLDLSIGAGPSVTTTFLVPTGAMLSTSSSTTCQGASFHIPVTVSVHA